MSDEVDTDATSVTQIALSLEEMGDNIYYDAAAILRALAAERDAERQRTEKAEAEKKTYESGWLEAEGIISDLQERAEKAEAKRDEYHDIANAYAAWAGDILELLEDKLGDLDMNSPSDEALKRLMDRAQAGIASEIRRSRAALRQDEGEGDDC